MDIREILESDLEELSKAELEKIAERLREYIATTEGNSEEEEELLAEAEDTLLYIETAFGE